MAIYKTDMRDIYFNLFEQLKVQDESDYEAQDLKEIISEFDKFIENKIYPIRIEADRIGVKLTDNGVKVPECFHKPHREFYENGWYGLAVSEDLGGMPAPESINYVCTSLSVGANVSFSMYYGLAKGAMNVLLSKGSEAQKNIIVPQMMQGNWGGTMCLTEPGAGSDVGAGTTSATPMGDGKYKIKGVKIFISSGDNDLYPNIIHLVLARTPNAPKGPKGLSLFMVPKYRFNDAGNLGAYNNVKCTKIEEKMGVHASATCELTFGGDGDCIGELVGDEFAGMTNMFIMMNEARLLCGVQAEGQANLVTMLTEQYINERVQFGTEIVNLPDVKRTFLKMRAISRGMRSLVLHTANLFDAEKRGNKEVVNEIALMIPICKAYCSDQGFNVAVDAIQLHGGYGFCTEYGIEQFARDTKITTIYEGTNGIQAIDFVTRKILKDGGVTFNSLAQKIMTTLVNPETSEFQQELELMNHSMKKAQEILLFFFDAAKAQDMDKVLANCTDFLEFCGHITVAWLLLTGALCAKDALKNSPHQEDKKYYQSKIIDFKIFCQHILVRNSGIAKTILNFKDDDSLNV